MRRTLTAIIATFLLIGYLGGEELGNEDLDQIRSAIFSKMIEKHSDPAFLDATPEIIAAVKILAPNRKVYPIEEAKVDKLGKFRGIYRDPRTGEFGSAHFIDSISTEKGTITAYYEWWASPEGAEFFEITLKKTAQGWLITKIESKGAA